MVAVSVNNLSLNRDIYNRVIEGYNQGDATELLRFMLEQQNWSKQWRSVEPIVNKDQSLKLTELYITLIKIADKIANTGEFNLWDGRQNEVLGHRGWYVRDYILPPLLKHLSGGNVTTAQQFFDIYAKQASPEYGVVQSLLTANDFRRYIDIYEQKLFDNSKTTQQSYFENAQCVFKNIISGRAVVLLTQDTIQAFCDFCKVFTDDKCPYYKPEYAKDAQKAVDMVAHDWKLEQQRFAQLQAQGQKDI